MITAIEIEKRPSSLVLMFNGERCFRPRPPGEDLTEGRKDRKGWRDSNDYPSEKRTICPCRS
jgi:hypothetical protein